MNLKKWQCLHWLLLLFCISQSVIALAQCPVNIGFESGTFANWDCFIGSISKTDGIITVDPSSPVLGRHTMLQNKSPFKLDLYGLFPVNCPNGSGYSIQLGNSGTGAQAERVSYTFTIPAYDDNYSIIYNYAVVFQNPDHELWQQPKFTANVFDVTNNTYINCSSFSYAASSDLPGFRLSPLGMTVFYKQWTPVTIKLSGYAGRTIRLEFTTNDCTRGGHFGYAYIDVNENCSTPISGNTQCLNDTTQSLVAPFGFSGYRWFNSDFSTLFGTNLILKLAPVPAIGTVFAVEVTPYPDQGCVDTVYTTIAYSPDKIDLKVPTNALVSCISTPVDLTANIITAGSTPELSFSYYTDSLQTNYLPAPQEVDSSGVYYIKATSSMGCAAMKPVTLKIVDYPALKAADPPPVTRPETVDLFSAISGNTSGVSFSYWQDSLTTIPVANPHAIVLKGTYYIKGINQGVCTSLYSTKVVVNEAIIIPPNAFSPNGDGIHDTWEIPLLSLYPQCVVEVYNRFGQLVFRSAGYHKPWDGKYNGIDQPIATYYYVIKPRSDLPPVGGSVTIIR